MEVRFAPQLHSLPDDAAFGIVEVIESCDAGLKRAVAEFNANIKTDVEPKFMACIIVCALRNTHGLPAPYYANLRKLMVHSPQSAMDSVAANEVAFAAVRAKERGCSVVALDIAGAEIGFPPSIFGSACTTARENGLHVTVHVNGFLKQASNAHLL